MSSSIDVRPTRVPEEMNLLCRQESATTRHAECRSALDAMSPKSPVTCGSYTKCNEHGALSRTAASGKDDDVPATLGGSEPDNVARLSWNASPSSSAFTTDRCSSSKEHDRPAYNCSTIKHRSRRRECDTRIYSHLFSSIYSITETCYHRVFRSRNLWKYDHRWGTDFPQIFLSFVCILFLMTRVTVHANHLSFSNLTDIDIYTPISKLPCGQGLSTPGVTRPYGDINIEYGTKPLRIMCILDPELVREKYPGKTSADLYFLRNLDLIDKKYITIMNETAILLEIKNLEPSKDLYTCGLRTTNDEKIHKVAVCLNEVAIGHKPAKPISFTCSSDNWESLHCSWVPVHNFVKTTYNLTFTLPGKRSRKIFPCPKDINDTSKEDTKKIQDVDPTEKNSCYWDTKTNPIYRQPYDTYTFILYASNPFYNTSFMYRVDHFSSVIPHSPTNLAVVNITIDSAILQWSLPFPLQNFPVGMHHRIMYQNQLHSNSKNGSWTVINITDKIREESKEYTLSNLNCGFCEFDVRILLKSATASDVEHMWSKPGIINFRTASDIPSYPPRIDIGSFETTENDDKTRDVYLYWQRIPQIHENGPNFTYEVDYVGKDGVNAYFKNKNSTLAFIKYTVPTNSNFLFKIASKNEIGFSNGRSEIFVLTQLEVSSLAPHVFTKIAYNETLYELSWKPPAQINNIKTYTIFWCEDTRDRPYQCTGYLDWVHVPNTTTMYNVTVPNPSKVYQFAISTNTESYSSGMVWASCTVIHNKVTSKMKDVWINSITSKSVEVGWKLDCSDRVGIIDGFNIYYCPIISPYNLQCQENTKKNVTIVAGPHTIHGTAEDLQPYTTYMLYVTVLTKFGEGSGSDVLYNTTLEDMPSTPPQNLQITNVTNTTINLQWEPPKEMNGVLRYYEVQYNDQMRRVENERHIELTNLEAYTRYNISVRACTISCSNTKSVVQLTEIGVPGKISRPYVYSTNGSEVVLKWDHPKNSGGPVHYYQIMLHDNVHDQHTNASEIRLSIPDCKDVNDSQEPFYRLRVRAVNVVNETLSLMGSWSDPVEVNCYSDGPSFAAWLMICITSIIGIGVLFGCFIYGSRRMWSKCRAMQDVEVKLPPGLAPNIKLLPNVGEQHIRQPSADSSGCSSAQDSVTSSLTTNSQVSNDSGTDMASDPASPDKLLESLPSWESKRMRQRNVGNAQSTENAQWESYVKVAKSGEPVLGETLSLTRSTPNLTESAGCTTSQHTWSSTGYISMPSSEEASSNPSPVPRENLFVGGVPGITTANYSVVGSMPKSTQLKPEDSIGNRTTATVGDALITLQAETARSSKPYIAFSALDKKLKKPKHATDSLDLDELTFTEPDKCNNPDVQAPSQFDPDSDKISKPYVQTGLIDTLEKQYLLNPIVDTKRNLLCGSFMSTGSHNKPFVPSFLPSLFSPTSESESPSSSTKPYVAVSSIPKEMTAPSPTHAANESSSRRPYVQHAIPAASNENSSKLYTLASSIRPLQHLQRGKAELCARGTNDEESCKKVNADDKSPSVKLEPNRSVFTKQNTGYVTFAENPTLSKLKSTSSSQKQLEKSPQQTPTTTNQSADEQYSKVTVVPSTM